VLEGKYAARESRSPDTQVDPKILALRAQADAEMAAMGFTDE
jgi:hypothetical protein